MATVSPTKLMTAEEFMNADLGEGTFELVRGEVIQLRQSCRNMDVPALALGLLSSPMAASTDTAMPCQTILRVQTEREPDTIRRPDLCFFSHARWPRSEVRDEASLGTAQLGGRGNHSGEPPSRQYACQSQRVSAVPVSL